MIEESKTPGTDQLEVRDEKGRFAKGNVSSGGFNKHPENISPGGWKQEDNIPHQYNLLLRMSVAEIKDWLLKYPEATRTMAQELAYQSVLAARRDLGYLREVTDRTSGKAPQTIVYKGGFFSETKLLIQEVSDKDVEEIEAEETKEIES